MKYEYLTCVQGFPGQHIYIRKAKTEVVQNETAVISLTTDLNLISVTRGLQSNSYTWGQNRNVTKLDSKVTKHHSSLLHLYHMTASAGWDLWGETG